jgi:hypothetical protein
MRPIVSKISATMKKSPKFYEKIKETNIANDSLVSFDVEALFSSISINEALELLKKRLLEQNWILQKEYNSLIWIS